MKNEGVGGGGKSAFQSCMGYQEYKWDVVEQYVQVSTSKIKRTIQSLNWLHDKAVKNSMSQWNFCATNQSSDSTYLLMNRCHGENPEIAIAPVKDTAASQEEAIFS